MDGASCGSSSPAAVMASTSTSNRLAGIRIVVDPPAVTAPCLASTNRTPRRRTSGASGREEHQAFFRIVSSAQVDDSTRISKAKTALAVVT